MVQKELSKKGSSLAEPFKIPGTVEYPTDVYYYIKTGIQIIDEGEAFPGAHLTLLGNDAKNRLRAKLNNISDDIGHFTSCETALVRTAKFQEVEKPSDWNFRALLSLTEVIPEY